MDDHEKITFRALGVPDILLDDNKRAAAAARLLEASGVKPQPQDPFQTAEDHAKDARHVVDVFLGFFRAGELDAAIGDYPGADREFLVRSLERAGHADNYHYRISPEAETLLCETIIDMVVTYAVEHPFGEDARGTWPPPTISDRPRVPRMSHETLRDCA